MPDNPHTDYLYWLRDQLAKTAVDLTGAELAGKGDGYREGGTVYTDFGIYIPTRDKHIHVIFEEYEPEEFTEMSFDD